MTTTTSEPSLSADNAAERRRFASRSVREARDKLTFVSKTKPAFDYELLRQYAQNRLSGSLVILMLVGSIGFLSSFWTGAVVAGAWTAAVLVIHGISVLNCRLFLTEAPRKLDVRAWRLRFIALDLFFGLAWTFNLVQ